MALQYLKTGISTRDQVIKFDLSRVSLLNQLKTLGVDGHTSVNGTCSSVFLGDWQRALYQPLQPCQCGIQHLVAINLVSGPSLQSSDLPALSGECIPRAIGTESPSLLSARFGILRYDIKAPSIPLRACTLPVVTGLLEFASRHASVQAEASRHIWPRRIATNVLWLRTDPNFEFILSLTFLKDRLPNGRRCLTRQIKVDPRLPTHRASLQAPICSLFSSFPFSPPWRWRQARQAQ